MYGDLHYAYIYNTLLSVEFDTPEEETDSNKEVFNDKGAPQRAAARFISTNKYKATTNGNS